jgi:hypothetical protein
MPWIVKEVKANGDEYSKATIKMYRMRLNKLSKYGITDTAQLLGKPRETLNAIADRVKIELGDTDDKSQESIDKMTRQIRRNYLNAIFYVLPAHIRADNNPYYQDFQSAKDAYSPE